MISSARSFRKMFAQVVISNNSDCSRIDAIAACMGVKRDIAEKIYFDKALKPMPCNVGYNMLLDGQWPIDAGNKTIAVFGRDVKVFNY